MKGKNIGIIAIMILVGLLFAGLILRMEPPSPAEGEGHGHEGHAEAHGAEGEHGESRHLSRDGFEIDLALSEAEGEEPRFVASAQLDEKPVDPAAVQLSLELRRPDGQAEKLDFQAEGEHLQSRQTVAEPHVFEVAAVAEHQGKTYRWDYWQVENGIELSPGAIEEAGIEIKTAGPAAIETVLALPGQIQLNPRKAAHVVPRVDGVAAEVRRFLGDRVKVGEILAVLDSRELADLKGAYLVAVRRRELARTTFEREQRLWKEAIGAEKNYLAAKNDLAEAEIQVEAAAHKLRALGLSQQELKAIAPGSAEPFSRYVLTAPFAGEIVEAHLSLREAVKADTPIFTLADLSDVWGEITVYAKDLSRVRVGQAVTVRALDAKLTASGRVFYLGPLVGEATRSARAYVEIPNPEGRWRPGLFITVEVLQERTEVPVAVAAEAIQTHEDRPVVFVQHDGLFEPRAVTLGRRDAAWAEVSAGLAAGERYAAHNSFVLKSELGKSAAAHEH
ncbi:membrane fusion protein, heavy metal efflux system [Methylococcus capsulatus]|uniref:Membrane fusion protein, heavy metal efflux system n=1 Tax=Methylococcus capsulatus TaxID=414 RepID=A0AA35Y0X7_METCP|nr:efflux RND transporter periplasmic adaptor subunit [Methylococcus capsulatus]CAI8821128.1 membrane fusion protein, heavy metal efflux system [Methylococcus capsulatus]